MKYYFTLLLRECVCVSLCVCVCVRVCVMWPDWMKLLAKYVGQNYGLYTQLKDA